MHRYTEGGSQRALRGSLLVVEEFTEVIAVQRRSEQLSQQRHVPLRIREGRLLAIGLWYGVGVRQNVNERNNMQKCAHQEDEVDEHENTAVDAI